MSEPLIINTGPLIALGKMDAFEVIAQLPLDFICPVQVQREIARGAVQGHSVSLPDWVRVASLAAPLSPLAIVGLDRGEAEVIQLALERGVATVCIDELKGRRAATAAKLRVVGSLGLIARAKQLGLIPAARPLIEKAMREGIFYRSNLVEQVLQALGE